MRKKIPAPENLRELAQGRTAKEIAKVAGVSRGTALRWLHDADLPVSKRGAKRKTIEHFRARYAVMIAERQNNATLEEIRARHGVSKERVRQIMEKCGIKRPEKPAALTEAETATFRELLTRASPLTWEEITTRMGKSYETLRQIADELGVRKINGNRKLDYEQIASEYQRGKTTLREVAERHGIREQRVWEVIRMARQEAAR